MGRWGLCLRGGDGAAGEGKRGRVLWRGLWRELVHFAGFRVFRRVHPKMYISLRVNALAGMPALLAASRPVRKTVLNLEILMDFNTFAPLSIK